MILERNLPIAAAVQRYQVRSGNRLRISVPLLAENPLAFATKIKRHKVIFLSSFTAIERHRGTVEGLRIKVAKKLL